MPQECQHTELANMKWSKVYSMTGSISKANDSMVVPVRTQHRLQMAVAGPGASAKQRFHEAPCKPTHILLRHRLEW